MGPKEGPEEGVLGWLGLPLCRLLCWLARTKPASSRPPSQAQLLPAARPESPLLDTG